MAEAVVRRVFRLGLVALHEVAGILAGRYSRVEGAHGLVRNEDGALLLVRPIFPPREWTVPGGKVERRERPHEAVAREVREETGIEVEVVECLLVDGHRRRTTDFVFGCRPVGGALRAQPEEIEEVRWVPEAQIASLEPKLVRLLALLPRGGSGPRYRSER